MRASANLTARITQQRATTWTTTRRRRRKKGRKRRKGIDGDYRSENRVTERNLTTSTGGLFRACSTPLPLNNQSALVL